MTEEGSTLDNHDGSGHRPEGFRLDEQVAATLAAARLRAARQQPYLAAALFALEPLASPGLGTVAVDRWWRLYVDPLEVEIWSIEAFAGALLHEVGHLVRGHADRGDDLGILSEDHTRWNVACDLAINDDLVEDGVVLPTGALLPERFGLERHATEEAYLEALAGTPMPTLPNPARVRSPSRKEDSKSGPGAGVGVGGTSSVDPDHQTPPPGDPAIDLDGAVDLSDHDCGSGAGGLDRPWEQAPPSSGGPSGLGRTEAASVRRAVQIAVSRSPGTVPGGWMRWATAPAPAPTRSWQRELRMALASAVRGSVGTGNRTYRRPDRRADSVPDLVLPGSERSTPEIAVIVDTSASMWGPELDQALAEADAVIAASHAGAVWLLEVDAEVQRVRRVRNLRGIAARGGGGTDLRLAIKAAMELRPRPEVLVILTDGETPWPDRVPPGCHLVVGTTSEPCPIPGSVTVAIGATLSVSQAIPRSTRGRESIGVW